MALGHVEPCLDDLDERIARDGGRRGQASSSLLVGTRPCPGMNGRRQAKADAVAPRTPIIDKKSRVQVATSSEEEESDASLRRARELHLLEESDDESDDLTLKDINISDAKASQPSGAARNGLQSRHRVSGMRASTPRGRLDRAEHHDRLVRTEPRQRYQDHPGPFYAHTSRDLPNGNGKGHDHGNYHYSRDGASSSMSAHRRPWRPSSHEASTVGTLRHSEAFEANRPHSRMSMPSTPPTRLDEGGSGSGWRENVERSGSGATSAETLARRAHIQELIRSAPAKLRELTTPSRLAGRSTNSRRGEERLAESVLALGRIRGIDDPVHVNLKDSAERISELSSLLRSEGLTTVQVDRLIDNLTSLTLILSKTCAPMPRPSTPSANDATHHPRHFNGLSTSLSSCGRPTQHISTEHVVAQRTSLVGPLTPSANQDGLESPSREKLSRFIAHGHRSSAASTTESALKLRSPERSYPTPITASAAPGSGHGAVSAIFAVGIGRSALSPTIAPEESPRLRPHLLGEGRRHSSFLLGRPAMAHGGVASMDGVD